MRISLAQIDISLGKPTVNLQIVAALAAQAAQRRTDVLVLPELWSTGYDLENAAKHAEPLDAEEGLFAAVRALAHKHGLHIVGSCLAHLGPDQYGNTIAWATPQGETAAVYTKTHLFGLMDEDQYLTPGENSTLVETPWGTAGLAICYDLRFPELFRKYALAGANMVILPSEWPHPRLAHWRTLLRARAIENQMYVVAGNCIGSRKGNTFFGHSTIIDPWGEIVVEAGESAQLITADIDPDTVAGVRERIPVFADRRPEIYAAE